MRAYQEHLQAEQQAQTPEQGQPAAQHTEAPQQVAGPERFQGLKNFGRKGLEMAGKVLDFNSHADWVEQRYADAKDVAKGWWKETVVETVRMNTVDKWRLAKQQGKANVFIQHKSQEIADLKGRMITEEQNIERNTALRAENDAQFGKSVAAAQDPTIRGIFEKTWREKDAKAVSDIENSRTLIGYFDDASSLYARDIVRFQEKVDIAGAAFGERLDARIEKIRNKNGYYEFQNILTEANTQLENCRQWDRYYDGKIAEYSGAVVEARSLGVSKADCQILLNGIAKFKRDKASNIQLMEQTRLNIGEHELLISDIHRKTARYENMKRELGLDNLIFGRRAQPQTEAAADGGFEEGIAEQPDADEQAVENVEIPAEQALEEGGSADVENIFEDGAEDEEADSGNDSSTKGPNVPPGNPARTDISKIAKETLPTASRRQETSGDDDSKKAKPASPWEQPPGMFSVTPDLAEGALADDETENVEARKEAAMEEISKKVSKLSEALANDSFGEGAARELYSATMGVGKIAAEYEDLLSPEEDQRLSEAFADFKKKYDREYVFINTVDGARQLKKDIINKIMRRLPDWFFAESN